MREISSQVGRKYPDGRGEYRVGVVTLGDRVMLRAATRSGPESIISR